MTRYIYAGVTILKGEKKGSKLIKEDGEGTIVTDPKNMIYSVGEIVEITEKEDGRFTHKATGESTKDEKKLKELLMGDMQSRQYLKEQREFKIMRTNIKKFEDMTIKEIREELKSNSLYRGAIRRYLREL